jgi:hypothetical protein
MEWRYPNNPKLWEDSTVYIVAGGPSLRDLDVKKIIAERKKGENIYVLGINKAYTLGSAKIPLCDAVYIGDNKFYKAEKEGLKKFEGLKFTSANLAVNDEDFNYIYRTNAYFTMQPGKIGWANNSGNAGINLAVQLGAKRIVLVAYDMGITGNQTNWHPDNHSERKRRRRVHQNYYDKVVQRISDYTAYELLEMGIEVINTNPNSGLDCFIKVDYNEWFKAKDKEELLYGIDDEEELAEEKE